MDWVLYISSAYHFDRMVPLKKVTCSLNPPHGVKPSLIFADIATTATAPARCISPVLIAVDCVQQLCMQRR